MRIDEAARATGCSAATVRRWIEGGELAKVQPGGANHALRIASDDLSMFIQKARQVANGNDDSRER